MDESCRSCWEQEGGRCYAEPVDRIKSGPLKGYSKKMAEHLCDDYRSKRAVLSSVIPNDRLVITSERHQRN